MFLSHPSHQEFLLHIQQGEHEEQELSGNTFVRGEGGRASNKNNKEVTWPRSG